MCCATVNVSLKVQCQINILQRILPLMADAVLMVLPDAINPNSTLPFYILYNHAPLNNNKIFPSPTRLKSLSHTDSIQWYSRPPM